MKIENKIKNSQVENVFHGRGLPEATMTLAGYAALIQHYNLKVHLPDRLSALSQKHRRYDAEEWMVFTPRHAPEETLQGHVMFALRHEALDLAVLRALFMAVGPKDIEKIIVSEPTGKHSRRLWFIYEWLMQARLDIPDSQVTNFVDLLDSDIQYPGAAEPSKRHRVRNNLPGVPEFCPLIRRTQKLDALMSSNLKEKAAQALGQVHPDVLARAAAFLLLKNSKASYAIEGERPPHNRAERWGRAIGQAGQQKLSPREFVHLQDIVIEDQRFVKMGWRKEGGFIGVHDRISNIPIPDHISARWQDVPKLIDALIAVNDKLTAGDYDPVLAASLIAFGFVFIHPFEDGNGRIHRYLIHHVLMEKSFAPKGIVFPVSAVILERIDDYRRVLEAYSRQRLDLIEWKPTDKGNVEVLNETLDLYRYFDATRQAEFLYECVRQTVEHSLPEEVTYLAKHDRIKSVVEESFEMPDRMIELLINFLHQGQGRLSKRAREKEFKALRDDEVALLETAYGDIFDDEKSEAKRSRPSRREALLVSELSDEDVIAILNAELQPEIDI
ncbi:hypothetical protein MMA231_03586 (plasmid) [Asticcacaulis sp. MM231]|uniref:Fic family protein n=1 Tax=Asticcacaulis sp. MM231 TaxID=3157666 RepID=UPI0032D5825E